MLSCPGRYSTDPESAAEMSRSGDKVRPGYLTDSESAAEMSRSGDKVRPGYLTDPESAAEMSRFGGMMTGVNEVQDEKS